MNSHANDLHTHAGQHADAGLLTDSGRQLISLDRVSFAWQGRVVLRDVTMQVNQGDFIAITGPNGGGKTTLLRILLGLLKPTRGTVTRHLDGARIGYLPQKNMIDSHFPVTVSQVIRSGLLGLKGLDRAEQNDRYERTIAAMGLEAKADSAIGALSGGQLQRALLGRAIIGNPGLLVLDEPLSYIDHAFEHRLYHLIEQIAKTATIVLVSHQMTTLAGMANRHLIVDGTLHQCGAHHHYVSTECDEC